MGLLDELKQEAQAVKERTERELSASQAKHELVETALRPRLGALYEYFRELREQLEVVDPDIRHDYHIEGAGTLRDLRQGRYRIATDDPASIESFTFHYACFKAGRVEFTKNDRVAVERQRESMWSHNLRFQVRDASHGGGATFLLEASVPVSFEFKIDRDRAGIALRIRNLEVLGTTRHLFSPERIDQEFMDELAKQVLGKPSRFKEITGNIVSDRTRMQLRRQIERERATKQAQAARKEPEKKSGGLGERFSRTLLGRK